MIRKTNSILYSWIIGKMFRNDFDRLLSEYDLTKPNRFNRFLKKLLIYIQCYEEVYHKPFCDTLRPKEEDKKCL